jgi:2-oxo-4-hydroxy-4-carboxy-5-ureidoimidazoline decarboxylase
MSAIFPVRDEEELLKEAEQIWFECNESDWREAFTHHPEIGDINTLSEKFVSTKTWAEGEQSGVKESTREILEALANGNRLYKEKFGYIFIVCATGKSAGEMLTLLTERMNNSP